jgi:hypothetical protein
VNVPDAIVWPEYNSDTKRYLRIGLNKSSAYQNLFGDRASFWLKLEPEIHALERAKSNHNYQPGLGIPVIVG